MSNLHVHCQWQMMSLTFCWQYYSSAHRRSPTANMPVIPTLNEADLRYHSDAAGQLRMSCEPRGQYSNSASIWPATSLRILNFRLFETGKYYCSNTVSGVRGRDPFTLLCKRRVTVTRCALTPALSVVQRSGLPSISFSQHGMLCLDPTLILSE